MSAPFMTNLDKKRREALYKLAAFKGDFVLAGGTAIILQIGHRLSYDFDLFSARPLKSNLLQKCVNLFGKNLEVRVNNPDLLLFRTPSNVNIDFVYFPFPPLHPIIDLGPVQSFSLKDLAANKAYTLGRRAVWRDYVDLFFILRWKITNLEQIIDEASERFKPAFNEKLFLEQLTFFQDLKVIETKFLKKSYTPKQIKTFLTDQVGKYLAQWAK